MACILAGYSFVMLVCVSCLLGLNGLNALELGGDGGGVGTQQQDGSSRFCKPHGAAEVDAQPAQNAALSDFTLFVGCPL